MPETPEKNAYEILGVSRTASQDDIKKRYRELARQYHPDVNQSNPAASKMFAQITGAYKALSDSNARANYDADLTLKERRAQATAPRNAPPPTSSTRPGSPTSAPSATIMNQQRNSAESIRLTAEANAAFARGRLVEARSQAEQALRLNRRNDKAYELLGDIYYTQAKTQESIDMYSMALQLNPRNPRVMQRLERLTASAGRNVGNTAQRVFFDNSNSSRSMPPPPSHGQRPPSAPSYAPRPSVPPTAPRPTYPSAYPATPPSLGRHMLGLLIVGFMGYIGVCMMIVYTALFHGEAPQTTTFLPIVSQWNGVIWSILALSGLIMGATMTITGAIRRLEDELVFSGVGPRSGVFLPMGLLVIVLAVLNFYLAALVYTVVSLLQESFTQSMGRVFGAVVGIVVLLGFTYTPGTVQVLLWGGNVVFLCFVIGWLLGDIFRPESV